jgi:tetratricopeptide (TPR) repeat protein
MGSPDGAATALTNIGDMRMALGGISGARSAYQESLETFRKNGENSKAAYPLVGLGDTYAASGDFTNAKKSYEEALGLSREVGEKHEMAVALANLGSALAQQSDLKGAREKYQETIRLRNEIGEKSGAAEITLLLANLAIDEGHPSEGEASARSALAEFRAAKMPELELSAHAILAQALLDQGKISQAAKEVAAGKPLAAKTQQRLTRLQFEIASAQVQAASRKPSDLQASTVALNAVIQETERIGLLSHLFEARLALGNIEMKYGSRAGGRARLAALQKDGTASGFMLIANRAAQALGQS